MARNLGSVISNNLSRGLITEATGLNFPENATTDSLNVVYDQVGSVRRRKGFDIEGSGIAKAYRDSDGLIKEFVWQAVARTGGFTFLVVQIGTQVNFYELTTSDAISAGIQPVSLDLDTFKAPGAGEIKTVPCSFAAGNGYLFVAHPLCDPIIVRWNEDDAVFEASRIALRVRDYEGVDDGLSLVENPVTMTDAHHYNLKNQGWNQQVRVGTSNNEAGASGSTGGSPYSSVLDWEPIT